MNKEAKGCLWEYIYYLIVTPEGYILLNILILLIIFMLINLGD